jgi:type II secretory ATPase GspE/PulE/Tfp pilus assembly ATPase PilB-like protein
LQKYARLMYQMMISDSDLQSAFALSMQTGKSIEHTLIERFHVPKVEIGKSLSHFYKSRFIEYDAQFPIATETFIGLRRFQLLKESWVPLSWDENGVVVLMDNPFNIGKTEKIKIAIETSKVIFAVGIREDIEEFINRGFNEIEHLAPFMAASSGDEPVDVAELLDLIIAEACDKGAAAIEFDQLSETEDARARFLMDGEWLLYTTFRHDVAMEIANRIKFLAGFHKQDSCLPKLGHIRVTHKDIPEFLLRVTMLPTDEGPESIVLSLPTI